MTQLTLTNSDRARRFDLNDKAVALSVKSAEALKIAAASGMYMLMHGHSEILNDLYHKLADQSPKDAYALRAMYANRVIDKFGKGGKRNADDTAWDKRPVPFIRFSSTIVDGKMEAFKLVDVKNNTSLSASDIANIKLARREIREAGENALLLDFMKRDDEARAAQAFGLTEMQKAAKNLLLKSAKNAAINGMTKGQISAAAKAFELSSDDINKILEDFNDGAIVNEGNDEDDEAESGVIFKAEEVEDVADVPPAKPNAKPKAKQEGANAH